MPILAKAEKKALGFDKSRTIKTQTHNTINLIPEEDPIQENPPEEHPEDFSIKILINPIAKVPLNKATKHFYEYLTGAELERPEETGVSHTCPNCPEMLRAHSRYLNGEWEDYYECECEYTEKERRVDDMTPEEVLDRIDEIPFENSELEVA